MIDLEALFAQLRALSPGELARVKSFVDTLASDETAQQCEQWTLNEPHKSRIDRGLQWASEIPAKETDLAELVAKAKHLKVQG